eukprot:1194141-Prorocentrum_minimum.AAC.2
MPPDASASGASLNDGVHVGLLRLCCKWSPVTEHGTNASVPYLLSHISGKIKSQPQERGTSSGCKADRSDSQAFNR